MSVSISRYMDERLPTRHKTLYYNQAINLYFSKNRSIFLPRILKTRVKVKIAGHHEILDPRTLENSNFVR